MPAQLIQAKALLLLATFLAAGTSLPSLDAVAYHHGADAQSGRSHVEPAGGCLDHSSHCALGRTAPGSGAGLPLTDTTRVEADNRADSPWLPTPVLFGTDRSGNPQSRAPPAPLA